MKKLIFAAIISVGVNSTASYADVNSSATKSPHPASNQLYKQNPVNKKQTDLQVLVWAYEAMLAANSYNFVNVKHQLSQAKPYFSEQAWRATQNTLYNKSILQKVIQDKLIVYTGLENGPLLLNKTSESWTVQMPLLVHFQNAKQDSIQQIVATMTIKAYQPGPGGLQIQSIEYGPPSCVQIKKC